MSTVNGCFHNTPANGVRGHRSFGNKDQNHLVNCEEMKLRDIFFV